MDKTTYSIQINDFHTDPDKCRTLELDVKYPTREAAVAAGWAILEAFALIHGLGYENQGDQFMAFYQGGDDDGLGALTIEVYDSNGQPVELYEMTHGDYESDPSKQYSALVAGHFALQEAIQKINNQLNKK